MIRPTQRGFLELAYVGLSAWHKQSMRLFSDVVSDSTVWARIRITEKTSGSPRELEQNRGS